MFIPLFIAILLGLTNPSETNNSNSDYNNTTVSANVDGDENPDGEDGSGGDHTGGETGQNPPPKIN